MQIPTTTIGVPGTARHVHPAGPPGQSAGSSPHAGVAPAGHELAHCVLAGLPAPPPERQHTWPAPQSAPVQGMAEAPLGHAAALAAQLPCTWVPIGVRQHTWEPAQFGQSLRVGPASAPPPLPAPLPRPLLAPPLPLPLPPGVPLLAVPLLAMPSVPASWLVAVLPPHAVANTTPNDTTKKTCLRFMGPSLPRHGGMEVSRPSDHGFSTIERRRRACGPDGSCASRSRASLRACPPSPRARSASTRTIDASVRSAPAGNARS